MGRQFAGLQSTCGFNPVALRGGDDPLTHQIIEGLVEATGTGLGHLIETWLQWRGGVIRQAG